MNRILFLLLLTFIAASCVPLRKEILLQGNKDADNAPVNTPVSNFKAKDYTYRLRPDDIISIKVSSTTPSEFDFFNQQANRSISGFDPRDPLLSGFKVEEDGTIPLPVVGKVEVEGLSVEEARAKVQEIVEQYLDSPTVDVKLLSFQFTLLGEIKSEGRYTTYNPKLNILEALGMAGGLTDYANRSRVKIVRKDKNDIEIAYVNLLDDDLITSPYYYLQPNDVVTVAPLGAKNWRTNNLANVGILFSGISSVAILLNYVLNN
jgi:polysaccharide export outer membrane protein